MRAELHNALRVAVLALSLVASVAARAAVDLPASLHRESEWRLLGSGRMSWFGLHLYDAALWSLRTDRAVQGVPGEFPFALSLRYARGFKGAKIAERSAMEIERLGFGDAGERRRWELAMRALFPDVRAGDVLTGVYRPGEGVQFFVRERELGRIDDPLFAQAFFSIWLDARTRAPELRERLIGTP